MLKLMKGRFLPTDYERILYHQYKKCKQGKHKIFEYAEEFHWLNARTRINEIENRDLLMALKKRSKNKGISNWLAPNRRQFWWFTKSRSRWKEDRKYEIRQEQVNELLEKGHIRPSLSPCIFQDQWGPLWMVGMPFKLSNAPSISMRLMT